MTSNIKSWLEEKEHYGMSDFDSFLNSSITKISLFFFLNYIFHPLFVIFLSCQHSSLSLQEKKSLGYNTYYEFIFHYILIFPV